MASPRTLYDVACPHCGAAIDEKCRTTSGRLLPTFHVRRRLLFRVRRAG